MDRHPLLDTVVSVNEVERFVDEARQRDPGRLHRANAIIFRTVCYLIGLLLIGFLIAGMLGFV